jgi:putative transcriptional regulator
MRETRLHSTLKVHRAQLDLTQEKLADLVGVTRKTINTVETGRFIPSTVLALKLARALGTTVEELFQLNETPKDSPPQKQFLDT